MLVMLFSCFFKKIEKKDSSYNAAAHNHLFGERPSGWGTGKAPQSNQAKKRAAEYSSRSGFTINTLNH